MSFFEVLNDKLPHQYFAEEVAWIVVTGEQPEVDILG